jgi:DNA sulfur modification protein DndD
LTLENYGLFRGQHTFELTPESRDRPIVLFGGKNGAGKTTLFEAVRLCLYGKSFPGIALSDARYEKLLRGRIHRYPGLIIQPDKTSITLEFKYVRFGKVDTYSVTRFWQDTGTIRLIESLEIYKNGQLLSDIETGQWQEFVKELIPPGVTRLFFFDGEQIQNLAEDEKNNIHLKDSFDSLTGLDVVERLNLDLRYIVSRMYRQSNTGDENPTINALYGQHEELKKQLDQAESTILQSENKIEYVKGQIQKQEQLIVQEGGGYANKRQELKSRKDALDNEIQKIEGQICDLMAGPLPFAVTPESCIQLRNQLLDEEQYNEQLAARKALEKKLLSLQDRIASDKFWVGMDDAELSVSARLKILSRLAKSIEELLLEEERIAEVKTVHSNLSGPDRENIIERIRDVLTSVPGQIKDLSRSLEKCTTERQEIEKLLMRSPPDEVLHPFIQELNKLHTELGALEQNLVHETKIRAELKFKVSELVGRLFKEYDKEGEVKKLSVKEQLAKNIQQLLAEYLLRIREKKLNALEENLVLALNHLSHKKIIEKAKIEAKDFSVVLYDVNRDEIPKEQLSAGEKQIYAIAMLWALAKTSGRPLPFIIDTPLGRLDADHRTNLVANFFPFASHQVIIFSTNTEIDEKYFEELAPHISRAYLIEYDGKQGKTDTTSGYFWKSKEKEVVVRKGGGRKRGAARID